MSGKSKEKSDLPITFNSVFTSTNMLQIGVNFIHA